MDVRLSQDTPAQVKYTKGIDSFSGEKGMVSIGNRHFTTRAFVKDQPYFDFKMTVGVGSIAWITE